MLMFLIKNRSGIYSVFCVPSMAIGQDFSKIPHDSRYFHYSGIQGRQRFIFFFNGTSYSVAGQALQTPVLLITGENLS